MPSGTADETGMCRDACDRVARVAYRKLDKNTVHGGIGVEVLHHLEELLLGDCLWQLPAHRWNERHGQGSCGVGVGLLFVDSGLN